MHCLALQDQHYPAWLATQRYNMSFGEYVGALIDRAEGRPTKLDGTQQGHRYSLNENKVREAIAGLQTRLLD